MNIFDLTKQELDCGQDGSCKVFYENDLFNARVIVLAAGQKMPECQVKAYVMFYVVKGDVLLKRNDETVSLGENHLFITEPAVLSLQSELGARLMGIQVNTNKEKTGQ